MKTRIHHAIAIAVLALSLVPAASASAESPWWQVLTGSRPTNLWEPTDAEQEIVSQKGAFGPFQTLAAKIEVGGDVVGCLGVQNAPGNARCNLETGFPASETAAQLEARLEVALGTTAVQVSGGPAGGAPLLVTAPDRGMPPIELTPYIGSASSKVLAEGGSGRLVLTVTNLGDAPMDATSIPVTIVDQLPEGVIATGARGFAGALENAGEVDCSLESSDEVACVFEGTLPSYEAIEIEIDATLLGEPPAAGAPGEVSVSGGDAAPESEAQALQVTPEPTPFGIDRFYTRSEEEGGAVFKQAGGHPFQFTTTLQMNSGRQISRLKGVEQPALPRNFRFPLPPGLVGNATAMPQCKPLDFFEVENGVNSCPSETAVGVASVTIVESATLGLQRIAVPLFNLPPAYGEPARFGFVALGVAVPINTAVDPADDYKITASVRNATQVGQLLSSTVSIWGWPGDPRHNDARGWECVYHLDVEFTCAPPSNLSKVALMRQSVQCKSPLEFGAFVEPWNSPIGSATSSAFFQADPLNGCNSVPFDPSIAATPTSKLAENPSGLNFRLDMPNSGLLNPDGIAEGQPKRIEVDLPEGMTVNPSQGEGLAGCSPADYARETVDSKPGEGCPEASKIGTVRFSTPLLEEEGRGSLYVASPYDNPFGSLLSLYMVAKVPERGILVKQAGKVESDPVTGQLTTTFDDLPPLPVGSFNLEFRPGGRAPLVTPPACGEYDLVARFTPWSAHDPDDPAPDEIITRTSTFTVDRGVDGGACPSDGIPPFRPGLLAGTINNAAGHYSPFNVRLTRNDGEQEFTNFSIKLPPGVVGKLAGLPFCSDAAIAVAKARTGPTGGAEELASPSCPLASQVGRTLVGAGVGSLLTYVPGKVYMAGPYNGSPLSVVAITAAKVGPFDLGTVVVRQALRINPETAEVFVDATGSDPIPHIIQGIPVHARDIRVYVDRPEFVLNPTSCERTSTASTVLGSGLDFGSDADNVPVTVTSPFQAADCASLGFKPRLQLSLRGKTRRGGNPALRAVMRPRVGDANAARISVALPRSEFLEQGHIGTVCTRVQFKAGAGNGTQCPAASIYGRVRAWTPLLDQPLEGPVFLRSSENPLPDLVLALHGLIEVHGVARIDSLNGGIRTTFDFVPDAPITKVVLKMGGGKKSLLVNSTNICRGKHEAIVKMKGHNGAVRNFKTPLKAKCGKKARKNARRQHKR
jgi:hypothetical protein